VSSAAPDASAAREPTVFVVDDDGSTRELLSWLMKHNDLAVEVFADARAFLKTYRAEYPGCLVLDLNMPGMSGLDLQLYLKEHGVVLPVIFLSGRADIPKAVQAVREGALDFLEKPFDYRRVVELVRECLERDRLERGARDRKRVVCERLRQLTQREREVLDLVVAGKLNREVAEALDISIKTVEAHRAKFMEKLEVSTVAELVQAVVAAG
jgi:FixJ family two-component response regulator